MHVKIYVMYLEEIYFEKKNFFMNILDGNAFMGLEKEFSLYIKSKTSNYKNEIKIPSVLKNTYSDTCTLYNMNIKPSQTQSN